VLPHSGCLAAHVAAHDAAPGPTAVTGYVYGFSLDYDDTGEVEQLVDVQDADAAIERMAAKQLHDDIRDPFYQRYNDDFADLPAPWVMFWSCNVSVRTEGLREAGLFEMSSRCWTCRPTRARPTGSGRAHDVGARSPNGAASSA
jgi:hypothetical protein